MRNMTSAIGKMLYSASYSNARRKRGGTGASIRTLLRCLSVLAIFAVLPSCNLILPRAPGIYVLDTGLGSYERRPTWFWEVYGPDFVGGFKYSFGSGTESIWIEVDPLVRSYRPPASLPPGEHTLRLQSKSISGDGAY